MAAKQKLAIEHSLPDINGLDYVIVRPSIVYGVGDRAGLSKSILFPVLTYPHESVFSDDHVFY